MLWTIPFEETKIPQMPKGGRLWDYSIVRLADLLVFLTKLICEFRLKMFKCRYGYHIFIFHPFPRKMADMVD